MFTVYLLFWQNVFCRFSIIALFATTFYFEEIGKLSYKFEEAICPQHSELFFFLHAHSMLGFET